MTTPSQVAAELRAIADKIDKSKQPDRQRVASALKGVLATIQKTAQEEQQEQEMGVAQEQQQAQQEQQALPKSGPGRENVKHMISQLEEALEKGDDPGFRKVLDALRKSTHAPPRPGMGM
jgi:type II secretory pathway pseudopilin PulG